MSNQTDEAIELFRELKRREAKVDQAYLMLKTYLVTNDDIDMDEYLKATEAIDRSVDKVLERYKEGDISSATFSQYLGNALKAGMRDA